MSKESIVCRQARKALSGNWTLVIAGLMVVFASLMTVFLFFVLLCYFAGFGDSEEIELNVAYIIITFLSYAVLMFLSPLKNGFFRLCYRLSVGEKSDFSDVFYFFSGSGRYFKAVGYNLLLVLRVAVYNLASFLPYNIISIVAPKNSVTSVILAVFFGVGTALFVLLCTFLWVREFVFVDRDMRPIREIRRASGMIISSHILDIITLTYRFIPWIALCFFVLPALYVIPYMSTAAATASKWFIMLYKENTPR